MGIMESKRRGSGRRYGTETERRGRIYEGNVGRKKARGRIPHPGFEESVMDAKTTTDTCTEYEYTTT